MSTIQDAKRLLAETETVLRGLMGKALREQRYADVAQMAGLADGLARLLSGQAPQALTGLEQLDIPQARPRISKKVSVSTKNEKSKYPYFVRDGDRLVKVGWSKKNKKSYEHRVPLEAVIAFVRHLTSSVEDGKVFAIEDLLPVSDPANDGEIPAYQIYVSLAWLRDVGAIQKRGRDGYTIRRQALVSNEIEKYWDGLNDKKS